MLKNGLDSDITEVSQEPNELPTAAPPNDLPMAGRNAYTELQFDVQ